MMAEAPRDPEAPSGARIIRLRPKTRTLSDVHRAELRASGLTDESIDASGFFTETNGREIADALGWRGWPKQLGGALMLPYYAPGTGPETGHPIFARAKPDHPQEDERKKKRKYEQPKGIGLMPFFPTRTRVHRRFADAALPLVLTEGEKKGALLDQMGYATIAGAGVDGFHDKAHRVDTDEFRLHPLIREHVVVAGRRCFIVFDSDQVENDHVQRAGRVLAGMLYAAGAVEVRNVLIPQSEGKNKNGIDDYFVDAGDAAVRALFDAAEPLEPLTGNEYADTVVSYRVVDGIPLSPKLRMPRGYWLERDGSLWYEGEKSNELIERAAIFPSRLVSDLYSGHELVELVFRRDRRWRTVVVPRIVMADARSIVGELAPLGAPVDTNSASKVVKWLRDFESTNERRMPRSRSVAHCGWHTVDAENVFVMNGDVLRREGSSVEIVVDRSSDRVRLSRGLTVAGTYEAHVEALRRAWAASPLCAAAIAASLAAPMLRLLGAPIFAIHLFGDSSRGKSSMLKVAASVFGNPRDEEWVSSWNSTTVGHEQRAAHLCDLPLCIDEAGVVDARDRERIVYMLMNGVGRTRGAKEGGLRDTASWRTAVLSTGEGRLQGESAPTGAQVRVLELPVMGFGSLDAAGVDEVRRACEENHGHVGRRWLDQLLALDESELADHRAALKRYVTEFQSKVPKEGVRARQALSWALLAYVEKLAHVEFGLGEKNGASICRFVITDSDAQVIVKSAADRALELVSHWLASEPISFPATRTLSDGNVGYEENNGRPVHGYYDDGHPMIFPQSLRDYLGKSNIDASVVLQEWKGRGLIRVPKGDGEDRFATRVRILGRQTRLIAFTERAGLSAEPGEPGNSEFGG